jgi:hypothetical protein
MIGMGEFLGREFRRMIDMFLQKWGMIFSKTVLL